MEEFSTIWTQIQEISTLENKFNEEKIIISGQDLRRIMKQSAKFGIENYQRLQQQCVQGGGKYFRTDFPKFQDKRKLPGQMYSTAL